MATIIEYTDANTPKNLYPVLRLRGRHVEILVVLACVAGVSVAAVGCVALAMVVMVAMLE